MLVNFDRSYDATRCLSQFLAVLAVQYQRNNDDYLFKFEIESIEIDRALDRKKNRFQLSSTGASLEST